MVIHMENVLQIRDLKFYWNAKRSDVIAEQLNIEEFSIKTAERVFIYGPSGCGKSTLLGLCAGVLQPSAGAIEVLGQDLSQFRSYQRDQFRVNFMGIIFQQFNLIPYLDSISNVLLPCQFSRRRRTAAQNKNGTAVSLQLAAQEILLQLGVDEALWYQTAGSLSIGQQQRVAAARALIGNPQLLIADEPTSALDDDHQLIFMQCLIEQCQRTSASLIFVSHDFRLAKYFDRVLDFKQWQSNSIQNIQVKK